MTATTAYEIALSHCEGIYRSGVDLKVGDTITWCKIAFAREFLPSGKAFADTNIPERIARSIVAKFPLRGDGHIRYTCGPTLRF